MGSESNRNTFALVLFHIASATCNYFEFSLVCGAPKPTAIFLVVVAPSKPELIAFLWLQLIWSPLNLWPILEWNLIFTFFVRQSFKGVSDLFLYIFLLQEIHGSINKTDILVYETIQYTLSLPLLCNTHRNKHMPVLWLSPTHRAWTHDVSKFFIPDFQRWCYTSGFLTLVVWHAGRLFFATFRCGNMLQVFESDSKTATLLSELCMFR